MLYILSIYQVLHLAGCRIIGFVHTEEMARFFTGENVHYGTISKFTNLDTRTIIIFPLIILLGIKIYLEASYVSF